MNWTSEQLWIAVAIIAILTYGSRALPFVYRNIPFLQPTSPVGKRLPVLGSTLLAALASVTIVPGFQNAIQNGRQWIFLLGCLATLAVVLRWREAGLAVLAGVAVFLACLAGLPDLFALPG